MLKSIFLASTAFAALGVCTACDQQKSSQAQQQTQERQVSELEQKAAPTAAERAVTETANEVEQIAAPHVQFTQAELTAAISVADVPTPATTLSTASVKTSSGQALGEVRSVVVGPDGKADAVVVEVGGFLNVGERAVSIDASKLTYMKDRNILVAAVVKAEIEAMPPMVTK